ncbi:MAG: hypothetical protein Q8N37_04610 [bacterium]|nr:hypothetical protein [bacterium]
MTGGGTMGSKKKSIKPETTEEIINKYNLEKDFAHEFKKIHKAKFKEIENSIITLATYYSAMEFFESGLNPEHCYPCYLESAEEYFFSKTKCLTPRLELYLRELSKNFNFGKITRLMLSQKYKVPDEPTKILAQLLSLWYLYLEAPNIPPTIADLRLDYARAKLITQALSWFLFFKQLGKSIFRVRKSVIKKKSIKDQNKQAVVEALYRMNATGMSFHKIARTIEKELFEREIYPKPMPGEKPKDHTKSIKRYLLEDDTVKKDLEKLGVINGQT